MGPMAVVDEFVDDTSDQTSNDPRYITVRPHTFGTPSKLDNMQLQALVARDRRAEAALNRRTKKRRAANKRAKQARKANR